jgi:hypothetical protein
MWWDDLLGGCCMSGVFDAALFSPWGWLVIGIVLIGSGIYIAVVEESPVLGTALAVAGFVLVAHCIRIIRGQEQ